MQQCGGDESLAIPGEACLRFDSQLADYLEGEDCPGVPAHAGDCVFCGVLLADLALLRVTSAEIECDPPPARVWAKLRARLVEERIIRRPRFGRRRPWLEWVLRPAPAAAMAAVLLLGFLALHSVGGHRVIDHQWTVSTANAPVNLAPVDLQLEASVGGMERDFQAQSASLDPAMKVAYTQGLQALDGEIRECQSSLASRPDDSLAREYLASAYSEKARVLASALEVGDVR